MFIKKIFGLSLFLFVVFSLNTALASNEFELWFEAGIKHRFSKKYRLDFNQHFRFDNNLESIDSISPELAFRYRIKKWINLKAGYRFIASRERSGSSLYFDLWHRLFLDTSLSFDVKAIELSYRFRFQEQLGNPKGEGITRYKHTFRNRIKATLNIFKDIFPFLSGELYLRANDNDGVLHKLRGTLGAEYKGLKSHDFELFYRIEKMLSDANDPLAHIVGFGYTFSF